MRGLPKPRKFARYSGPCGCRYTPTPLGYAYAATAVSGKLAFYIDHRHHLSLLHRVFNDGRCEPGRVVVTMATRDTVTWFVCCGGCDPAQRQEKATQAAHHLHQLTAPAADQEVSANAVPRTARASRTRRLAWTYADTGNILIVGFYSVNQSISQSIIHSFIHSSLCTKQFKSKTQCEFMTKDRLYEQLKD